LHGGQNVCPYTILSFETFLKTKSNSIEEKKSKTLAFRHIFIFTYSREVLFPQNSLTKAFLHQE